MKAKRLTKNKDETKNWQYLTNGGQLVDKKLSQLEDIEEELGVDLITLWKAHKNGIWTKADLYDCILDNKPRYVKGEKLHISKTTYQEKPTKDDDEKIAIQHNVWCIHTFDYEYEAHVTRLQDYGKTWALTREELER